MNIYNVSLVLLKRITHITKRSVASKSVNTILAKNMANFSRLPVPQGKIYATYVWIDGSRINLRSKDRILHNEICTVNDLPKWSFDGSSTGQAEVSSSDTVLIPVAMYKDPFRMEPHLLVLCETYKTDGNPTYTNNRKYLKDQLEAHKDHEPWFGIEQECVFLDLDGWGLGWPKAGYPTMEYKFSYCGVGGKYVVGRTISEAHARCCLYSCLDFEGTNAEVMMGAWEWQIGTSIGIKVADDLWMSRYIMGRISEYYGVHVSYHPKPFGADHPGIGMHTNLSTKKMREQGGYKYIEEAVLKLEKNHVKHMDNYDSTDGKSNKLRLTGKFETSSFDTFSWGVGDRSCSVRIPNSVIEDGHGYLEDRRPAGDSDPYLVCGLLIETGLAK